jgi:hypothetical protein
VSYHLLVPNQTLSSPHILSLGGRGIALGERSISEVWLDDSEVGEESLGLLILNARVDNNIVSWNPVDGSSDSVLISGLSCELVMACNRSLRY